MTRPSRIFFFLVIAGGLAVGAYVERDWLSAQYAHLTGLKTSEGEQTQARNGRRGGGTGRRPADLGPIPVLAAEAKSSDVPVFIDGIGSVKALNSVIIRPQVSGKIVDINFTEGQDVKRGDVIARLDDSVYRAQRDQAVAKKAQDEALLKNAQLDLERYQRMVQSASGTQQQADTQKSLVAQYQAQIQSDQAAIDSAQATLDYATILAPIDGRTGIRNVDIGNLVSSTDATGIVTLSQIKPISVLFSIPQQQLARVNAAAANGSLSVQALSADGRIIDSGSLLVVDNQVDATTGTVKLKASFANDKLALWPGAFVNARLLVETMKGVIVIPSAAVQRGPNGTFVYVVQPDDTVTMNPVKVKQQDDAQAVIDDGISAGEKIVTTGFAQLRDKSKIRISDPVATPQPDDQTHQRGSGKHRHDGNQKGNSEASDTTSAISPQPAK